MSKWFEGMAGGMHGRTPRALQQRLHLSGCLAESASCVGCCWACIPVFRGGEATWNIRCGCHPKPVWSCLCASDALGFACTLPTHSSLLVYAFLRMLSALVACTCDCCFSVLCRPRRVCPRPLAAS